MTDNQTLEESVVMMLVAGFSLWLMLMAAVTSVCAQVLTPMELSDVKAQRLQQRYFKTLAAIGGEIEAHKFPYPFYFSRVLDIISQRCRHPTSVLSGLTFTRTRLFWKSQAITMLLIQLRSWLPTTV